MFFSRRDRRANGRNQRPAKRPFRPSLEHLEDRITPTNTAFDNVFNVTSGSDTGANSLRQAILDANAYVVNPLDPNIQGSANVFTINLEVSTVSLNSKNTHDATSHSSLIVDNPSTAATPLTIVITGQNGGPTTIQETDDNLRILQVDPNSSVLLQNVTLTGGHGIDIGGTAGTNEGVAGAEGVGAGVGGGLLNLGGNVAMSKVTFTGNGATGKSHGAIASGGAIFSTLGSLTFDAVTLSGNSANGANGSGPNRPADGADAQGGALSSLNTNIITTNALAGPNGTNLALPPSFNPSSLTGPLLEVTGNVAKGGDGGDDTNNQNMPGGQNGGDANGGGLWLNGGTVSLVAVSMSNNQAIGGKGGDGVEQAHNGSDGGDGGDGKGGAIYMRGEVLLTIRNSEFGPDAASANGNTAIGGAGGKGGDGLNHDGGAGGEGGDGHGGAIDDFDTSGGALLHLVNSTVALNQALGGNGGPGGISDNAHTAGDGGKAGSGFGGGIEIAHGTAILTNNTVAYNTANGGSPGQPGNTGKPGDPGDAAEFTNGGGISMGTEDDEVSTGVVTLTNNLIALNSVPVFGTDVASDPPLFLSSGGQADIAYEFAGQLNLPSHNYISTYNQGPLTITPFFNFLNDTPINGNKIGGFNASSDPALATTTPVNNGGPTFTIATTVNSPSLDPGTPIVLPEIGNEDQRGVARTAARVDIGAYQFNAAMASINYVFGGATVFSAASTSINLSVTISDPVSGPVNGGNVSFMVTGPGLSPNVVGSATASVNSSGQATVNIPLSQPLVPGQYTVTATYSNNLGTFPPGAENITFTNAPTTVIAGSTTVTTSASTQNASVSATVTSPNGPVNEGAVTFSVTVNVSSGPPVTVTATSGTLVNGQTGPVTLALPANIVPGTPYTITETYSDAADFSSNTANGTLTVNAVPPAPPAPPPPEPSIPQPLQVQIVSPPAPTPIQLFIDGFILAYDLAQPNGVALALANAGLVSDLTIAGLLNPFTVAGYNAAHGTATGAFSASNSSGSSI